MSLNKNKTIETTKQEFFKYFHVFGRPVRVTSDGGPTFMQAFTDFLDSRHVSHYLTSAYRAQSNRDVEAGVKSVPLKLDKMDERTLRETTYNHNNSKSEDGSGNLAKRFFRRSMCTRLPNSFCK